MSDVRVPELNSVTIAGRMTRDPELKHTGAGKPFCKFGIANTQYFKGTDGDRRESTVFVDVTVWGVAAEWVSEKLAKGRPVIVEGRLSQSEWEDRETGQKRSKIDINASRVYPLDWDGDSKAESPAPRQEQRPSPQQEPQTDDIPF